MDFPNLLQENLLVRSASQYIMDITNTEAKPVKRENPFTESLQPKCVKQQQDDQFLELEPDYFLRNIGFHNSNDNTTTGNDELNAAPVDPQVQVSDIQERLDIKNTPSMVEMLVKKMNSIQDIYERERICHEEIERINFEIGTLEDKASGELAPLSLRIDIDKDAGFVQEGKVKWLVARIGSLSEEKEVLRTILEKAKQKQAKLRRREKKRRLQTQREAKQQRQLEAKRQSNKRQLRSQSIFMTPHVPHVDLTAAPVKTERDTMKTPIIKELEVKIKVEPRIKIEED
jgi:hypothetical protein